MKHTYTEEEKEKIAQMLFDFLREHRYVNGKQLILDSIDFIHDLFNIKDVTDMSINKINGFPAIELKTE